MDALIAETWGPTIAEEQPTGRMLLQTSVRTAMVHPRRVSNEGQEQHNTHEDDDAEAPGNER